MSKIPCRKCNSCGFYHDLSVLICEECKADIKNVPALMMETEEIPVERYGEINEGVPVFVQKCSACGALNFTPDEEQRVVKCYNCNKSRVQAVKPVKYVEEDEAGAEEAAAQQEEEKKSAPAEVASKPVILVDEDDEADSSQWQGILGNIKKSIGAEESKPEPVQPQPSEPIADDDDDDADWGSILGGKPAPKREEPAARRPDMTLTALRYGSLTFTVAAEPNQMYLLGRSANQASFLNSDARVGNEHCYLIFRDGGWIVRDNHSTNGTAVKANGTAAYKDIGYNGECPLRDGDELMLGHNSDSMAFRITIK